MPSVLAGLVTATDLFSGSGKTQVVDGSGNVIGSQENGGIRGLAVTQSGTYYDLVASNSSTSQLAASATFTGSIEFSANQQAISILCTSDQPITLTLAEFIDAAGTRQTSSRTFNVAAGVGFSRCVQLNGNYFRVSAQNTGASTTTTFTLDVATGTLQSQTQSGNQPIAINEIDAGVTFPLPAGAATSANQTNGTARTQLVSSGGNAAAVSTGGAVSTQVVDQTAAISIAANATSSGQITGLSNVSAVTVQLTGTFVATVQIQVTFDGTTWVNVTSSSSILNLATGTYITNGNLTAVGIYQITLPSAVGVRVISTAYTSGTVAGVVRVSAGSGASATLIAQQGGTWNVATLTTMTAGNLNFPQTIADVASAAITTTTTTSAFTPTFGCSFIVVIPVTATSGTNQTLDIGIDISDDSGTNWVRIYDFPRITGTGIFRSPKFPMTGNRVRYVQTVGGTSPSFTRSINRLQCSDSAQERPRQLFDRAVSLTTLNATTTALDVRGCNAVGMTIDLGAATTPPALQLEGSEDNSRWYAIGSPLTGVANSTVYMTASDVAPAFLRARVSTAGVTVTPGYVLIKGW